MAAVSLDESDFQCLVLAALDAQERGDLPQAEQLDKIARKLNLALSTEKYRSVRFMAGPRDAKSWKDMPTCLKSK